MKDLTLVARALICAAIVLALGACSQGSGDQVQQNAPPSADESDRGIVYNGPAPSTDDVQNFKINVWDNLAGEDKCGACHVQGGQPPSFVRADDINSAYSEANSLVDLGAPALSRLVTKVSEGHNCWRPEISVCADTITNYIENWASASGAVANTVVLTAPPVIEVGVSKSFPADTALFESTVYPLVKQYCEGCHSEEAATRQQPFLGSEEIDVAYLAARSRINLDEPQNSRLVSRLGQEFHNCWTDCPSNAAEMQSAIQAFADGIPLTEINPELVVSNALGLPDGIVASSGGRIESAVIAQYDFKTGSGAVAYDTSGVEPALDLQLSGDYEWVGSWGVRINDGKAQGATSASEKLHQLVRSTGEFAIEAWVIPDNVAQDGPARIVTYSGGPDARNFTLGQTTYDYDFLVRHSEAEGVAGDLLSTPSADEVLQATLQHVVVNFDPIDGRTIYVNGELAAEDTSPLGNFNDWDPTYALAVGNEVDNDYLWMGTIRMLSIHNRTLSAEDVFTNFDVGVGEKFFLLFGLSHLIGVPEAYIVFEVQQYDNYGYLFADPFFISLDETAVPDNLNIRGLRIGLNGKEVATGQVYANLDISINADNYDAALGTPLSDLGAIIPLDRGSQDDQFFLSFDSIGGEAYARPAELAPVAVAPVPGDATSDVGVRTFDEINLSYSQMTGVPVDHPVVAPVLANVRQAMPVLADPQAFLASHQSGVMQLGVAYCSALVGDSSLRAAMWPSFNFAAAFSTAFDSAGREHFINRLMTALLTNDIDDGGSNVSLTTQPVPADVYSELDSLITNMQNTDTSTAAVASCSAALASAIMLVQ
ncbi:LamG domain-containing protein [Agaribacterium haliotis]|uniref:LamG domain-containing protein n=1 Tax=Agaribacterium haliotis TaxID=2013869 RepID=UPI000BB5920B|nr:LamG domain-containing protein [Agaribacterium haliotis]